MTTSPRRFEAKPAVREQVPLLIGLTGPSGSGKTYSALRLAAGIQKTAGGKIFGIDTEAKRMLHYADMFKFEHIDFHAPFGSLDYLAALQYAVDQGAKVIIVDSMSHEHSGPGGMIEFQEAEMQRMAGDDYQKRERVKMLAWSKPKQARRRLVSGILQLGANFIFCFRAKNISKPIKKDGKTEVVNMGFVAESGEELIYEQTVNCLLLPKSGGIPTWNSENPGEAAAMKLPEQFREIFATPKPLDEDIGSKLARWAAGGAEKPPVSLADLETAARLGTDALKTIWAAMPAKLQKQFATEKNRLKQLAATYDQMAADPIGEPPVEPAKEPEREAGEEG